MRFVLALALALPLACTPQTAEAVPSFDVYEPANPNGSAVIAVHGGGWYKGSAASMERICREIVVPAGATCFAPDYTLSGVAPFPAANHDLLEVVTYVRSLGFERVGAIGSSAGGNLVAWLATRGVLDTAVVWSAPSDLTVLQDWPPRAIKRFAPTRRARVLASPALHDASGSMLILHAADDPLIPISQARRLNRSLDTEHKLVVFPGDAHGLRLFPVAAAPSMEWLAAHLSPPSPSSL